VVHRPSGTGAAARAAGSLTGTCSTGASSPAPPHGASNADALHVVPVERPVHALVEQPRPRLLSKPTRRGCPQRAGATRSAGAVRAHREIEPLVAKPLRGTREAGDAAIGAELVVHQYLVHRDVR
jgi:hypothetical protein